MMLGHTPHQPCMHVHLHVHVCICACELLAWQTLVLFLGELLLPSGGPHWGELALSVSLSQSGSLAKPGRAGSLTIAVHNSLESWPVRGPAPKTLCYTQMLGCLLAVERYVFTYVQQVDQDDPTPSVKTDIHMQSFSAVFMHVEPVSVGSLLQCSIS